MEAAIASLATLQRNRSVDDVDQWQEPHTLCGLVDNTQCVKLFYFVLWFLFIKSTHCGGGQICTKLPFALDWQPRTDLGQSTLPGRFVSRVSWLTPLYSYPFNDDEAAQRMFVLTLLANHGVRMRKEDRKGTLF